MILDGKEVAEKVKKEVKMYVETLGYPIKLAAVLVGDNSASKIYVGRKQKSCAEVGIESQLFHLPSETTQEEILELLGTLNQDSAVTAILVQLPLPKHIDEELVLKTVDPKKDVDGFNPLNLGKLAAGNEFITPATPTGIIRLLHEYTIPVEGKHVVIIGRSAIVGRPMALMMINRHATVSVCHSRTKNLAEITRQADIIVVAAGKQNLLTADMIKEGAVVVDVGINRTVNKIVGDVDFESMKDKAGYITPVPGGVGPMTVATLLHNTLQLARVQHEVQ